MTGKNPMREALATKLLQMVINKQNEESVFDFIQIQRILALEPSNRNRMMIA